MGLNKPQLLSYKLRIRLRLLYAGAFAVKLKMDYVFVVFHQIIFNFGLWVPGCELNVACAFHPDPFAFAVCGCVCGKILNGPYLRRFSSDCFQIWSVCTRL